MSASVEKPMIQAARGEKPLRHPIWFLRQAGRYLPEYRKVREPVDFLTACKTPAMAAEITLQPLRRFDLDASIIFSDILVIPDAMGLNLSFNTGHGPVLGNPVRTAADVARLRPISATRDLGYVGDAIALVKAKLRPEQVMIGFAGAPLTVASYMIEGGSSREFGLTKRMAFDNPKVFSSLLDTIAAATTEYLCMQVDAGAEMIMLFDTWAGMFHPSIYRSLVFETTNSILSAMRARSVPVIYFPGQGSDLLGALRGVDADVIAVDWRTSLTRASRVLKMSGVEVTLQGNLDPISLTLGGEFAVKQTRDILQEVEALKIAHIFNVGHGLVPETKIEAIEKVIAEIRNFKA